MFQITVLVALNVYILSLKSGVVSGNSSLCWAVCGDTVNFHTDHLAIQVAIQVLFCSFFGQSAAL